MTHAGQAGEPDDLALLDGDREVLHHTATHVLQHELCRCGTGAFRRIRVVVRQPPAEDVGNQVRTGESRGGPGENPLAVPQHGDGVAVVEHLAEPVADEDDARTQFGDTAHHGGDLCRLAVRQRRRRFVENEQVAVVPVTERANRSDQTDERTLRRAEVGDQGVERQLDAETFGDLAAGLGLLAITHPAEATGAVTGCDADVLADP